MLCRIHKVYALDVLFFFLSPFFVLMPSLSSLLYYSGVLFVYFTFSSAVVLLLPNFCFSVFFFAFLITHSYILPFTFAPSSGRKQDSECRTKEWGRARRKKSHRSILLHTYIALDGIWDRFGLVISKCLVLTLILLPTSLFLLFCWYTHTDTHRHTKYLYLLFEFICI